MLLGRRVPVNNGRIADAVRRLDTIIARNRVKAELRRGERHEKPGVKRRRLKSERWRRVFAHEVCLCFVLNATLIYSLPSLQVRKNVQLVNKIRRRGA